MNKQQFAEQFQKNDTCCAIPSEHARKQIRVNFELTEKKMNSIPDEVILQILGCLSLEAVSKCSLVCHRWNRLCNDSSIWRNITLTYHQLLKNKQDLLLTITKHHPHVRSLSIQRWHYMDSGSVHIDCHVWKHFQCLESFSVIRCLPCAVHWIPGVLHGCSKTLKELRIEGMDSFRGEHFHTLFKDPKVQLRELSLAHCRYVDDVVIFEMANSQRSLQCFRECLQFLEELNLDGLNGLGDSALMTVFNSCPLLKSLTIDGENNTDLTSERISTLLPNIEHLYISFCTSLTNKSLYYFAKLKFLKSLHLRKSEFFTSEGFELLSVRKPCRLQTGEVVGKIKQLSLIECPGLKDKALIKLAESFRELNHLDISWCWYITDLGLHYVSVHCRKIETLKLVGLKRAQCVPILENPMSTLRTLDLTSSNLVDDGRLVQLKKIKPWIDITDYYGNTFDQ